MFKIILHFVAILIALAGSIEYNKVTTPVKEPSTIEELGELLFFDKILSGNKSISCASCHKPNIAFADNVAFSFGVDSLKGIRNTPSAMNVGDRPSFFWDGRAASLEEQALIPISNPIEMNLKITEAINRLNKSNTYSKYFNKLFKENANAKNLGIAIAAFEKTLETSNTSFDRYMNGDSLNYSESAKRGRILFNVKGKCFDCHFGPDFTGDEFRNIGLYNGKELNDEGRSAISKNEKDKGKFKTPSLRNVAVTGPYMHNGMFTSLSQVIDYYNTPTKIVSGSINTDSLIVPDLLLSKQDKIDLENFLNTLTDDRFLKK